MSLSLLLAALLLASDTQHVEINAQHYVVAAGRHFAVHAGVRMLESGGNAFDAGAAAVFAAAMTEFHLFGLGGEAPAILYDARERKVVVLNGMGVAPAAATPEVWQGKPYVDYSGPRAATVPAVVDSLCLLLQEHGTKSFGEVLAPAIELADGFPMYDLLSERMAVERKNCEPFADTMRVYFPGGKTPRAGEIFRQPDLARTLRALVQAEADALAKGGDRRAGIEAARRAFYTGDVARRMVLAARAAGGLLTEEDLATFHGRFEEPVRTTYRGFEIAKPGFWTQGPVLLQTLNILEQFDLTAMGLLSADYVHTTVEAMKLAFDDRDAYYGDPQFASIPAERLLAKDYAKVRAALIDRKRAALTHRPGLEPQAATPKGAGEAGNGNSSGNGNNNGKPSQGSGDTTAVQVVDAQGNFFSATVSGAWILDGAFIAGDTGVPLSQRMQSFSLDPKSPNLVQPRKRPRITLTPTLVLAEGAPVMAIGTPGGDSQDQQILNVLLTYIHFGLPLQNAIEVPRFNSEHMFQSFRDHKDAPGVLTIEDRVPAWTLDELTRRGHQLKVVGPFGMATGIVAILRDPVTHTLIGGSDPRRERAVWGW